MKNACLCCYQRSHQSNAARWKILGKRNTHCTIRSSRSSTLKMPRRHTITPVTQTPKTKTTPTAVPQNGLDTDVWAGVPSEPHVKKGPYQFQNHHLQKMRHFQCLLLNPLLCKHHHQLRPWYQLNPNTWNMFANLHNPWGAAGMFALRTCMGQPPLYLW